MTKEFKVVRPFDAAAVISGRTRYFTVGEMISSDGKPTDGFVTIEADFGFFLVEQQTFEACCKENDAGNLF